MTATVSRFESKIAPCGRACAGEELVSEDLYGLVTDDLRFDCGCKTSREEYHDGSLHLMAVDHRGKVLMDEELRGE